MKKACVFLGVFMFLLISCGGNNWEDSIITNNSSYKVSFNFNHTGEKKLAVGESTTFETIAYQHIETYSPNKRVSFKYEATNVGYTGEFVNKPFWEIRIDNLLGEDVTLSTNDWFTNTGEWIHWTKNNGKWEINDNYIANTWMEIIDLIIPGNADDVNHSGIIYTQNPVFIVTKPDPKMENNPPEVIGIANYNVIGTTIWITIQKFFP